MHLKKSLIILIVIVSLSFIANAANELSQDANRLNYDDTSLSHTVTVSNTGTESVNISVTCPSDISFSSGSSCSSPGATIDCIIGPSGTASYTVLDSNSTVAEYTLSTCYTSSINNSYTSQNNISFIRVKNQEIMHTLVEYGRGRGNYFYDTFGSGTAGSGHSSSGCNYVPNNTLFELSFLHKVLNIKQWYGNLTANVYNATFSCVYPNRTIVRQHLISAVETNGSGAYLSYRIPKIEGSWERMGYLSMGFDSNEQSVGGSLSISCTNMTYLLPSAYGSMVVDDDSFTLEVRNPHPFTAAASATSIVGNGTQEVLITYNITNTELYSADNIIIEIEAPQYATFIGTRSELWGAALDQYRIERTQLASGESAIVQLYTRFDTSNAPSISSIDLTEGINVEYVTCWESNAYNPNEYSQTLTSIGSTTVNMSISSTILGFINSLQTIENVSQSINSTVLSIESTVNNIEYMVNVINSTTNETNALVKLINSTVTGIYDDTATLVNNTQTILTDTNLISEQLDCDLTSDSPICDRVSQLNSTINNVWSLTLELNYTANNINVSVGNMNVTGVNVTVNIDLTSLEASLYDIGLFLNCTSTATQANESVCNRLSDMESTTAMINNTIQSILNTTLYFNQSIFSNLTFQNIIDAINSFNVDTSGVLSDLQEIRQFDEELVFLVTDSFGLQHQAKSNFNNGFLESATTDLMDANLKLIQAADRVIKLKSNLQKEELSTSKKRLKLGSIWKTILTMLAIIVSAVYLFGKPSKKQVKR